MREILKLHIKSEGQKLHLTVSSEYVQRTTVCHFNEMLSALLLSITGVLCKPTGEARVEIKLQEINIHLTVEVDSQFSVDLAQQLIIVEFSKRNKKT